MFILQKMVNCVYTKQFAITGTSYPQNPSYITTKLHGTCAQLCGNAEKPIQVSYCHKTAMHQ